MAAPSPDDKQYIFDKPENVKRVLKSFYIICGLLVVIDFFIHRHAGFWWENMPAFYALYGFSACVALVVLAKQVRKLVMRKEDYYDE